MSLHAGMSWENFAMGASFINLILGSGRHFYVMQHQYSVSFYFSHNELNFNNIFKYRLGLLWLENSPHNYNNIHRLSSKVLYLFI